MSSLEEEHGQVLFTGYSPGGGAGGKGAACFYISYWVLAESYKCESMKG